MAQFVIIGTIGKDRKYLASDNAWYWTPRLASASIFGTQEQAESILQCITGEGDSQMINCTTHETEWDAPRTLRNLAELNNDKTKADIKISIAVISVTPLSTQRWHVEDGKGRTKRLS